MVFVLFALWILFSGQITLEIVLFGIGISLVVYLFMVKMLGYNPKTEWKIFKKTGGILKFLFVFMWEVIKTSFHVLGVILSKNAEVNPRLVFFYTDLKTDLAKTALANAITLTPGTITVFCEQELFCVHALDEAAQGDVDDSKFMHMLKKLEE